jgi:small-conductance mechanosensitive channel
MRPRDKWSGGRLNGDDVDLRFWVCPLIGVGVAGGASVLALLIAALIVRIGRRQGSASVLAETQLCRRPLLATGLALALTVMVRVCSLLPDWERATAVVLIVAVCWLFVRVVLIGELILFHRLRMDIEDNRRVRRARTQVTLVRRFAVVLAAVLGLAGALMTFPQLHALGASVFASAGLAGVLAGLAAQTTLANMLAGLQLVFTDAVRMDDVVVVEGEWGWVEEITLTYVVVHIWDERRLVLPTSYFTSKPFQNWTRHQARVLGAVVLYLDYATPLAELRERAREVIGASLLWDRRDWVLQVIDTTEHAIVVRVLASAVDGPTAWDLRCEIREALVMFLQENYPQALPVHRFITLPSGPGDFQDGGRRGGHPDRQDLNLDLDLDLDHAAVSDLARADPRRTERELEPVLVRRADLRRAEKRSRRSSRPAPLPQGSRALRRHVRPTNGEEPSPQTGQLAPLTPI